MALPNRNLILTVASCLSFFVQAQGHERDAARRVHFTVYSALPITGLSYLVTDRPVRQSHSVEFFMTSRSPIYERVGPGPVEFVDQHTGATVAQVDIPAEVAAPMLFFFPIEQPAGAERRFRVLIYDDSWSKLSTGGLVVLNFTGNELRGTIDRKNVDLAEGYSGPYQVGSSAQVQLRATTDQKSYSAFSGAITLGKSGRALLVVLPPRYRGSREIQTRVLLDEAPVPDKKGGAAKP